MTDVATGTLEVGTNGQGEVVINHPDLMPDENGVGHIVFSPDQASQLAWLLQEKASDARREVAARKMAEAAVVPVDRSKRELVSGKPVPEDWSHTQLKPNGQQQDYVVLSQEERGKGFVRSLRRAYKHVPCGKITTMSLAIAETMARDPGFYQGGFCTTCGEHFPNDQFVWPDDGSVVGS